MNEIEFEIDGKLLKAKPNQMVIQVADAAGIYIPRFCYHKHLSVAANCRMCLVEVEKSPKPLPACATPVMPGMKVLTKSSKAIVAQKAVMEFLLINHPLDCPICDQGGECELQDLSMGYGSPESYFTEGKRAVKDQDLGPLIDTAMTRCIQCTRCVRFGEEIAGMRELGAVGRGEHMEIGTYIEHAIQSEVSGNIIDLCPVGALTSKPFRFMARAWELNQYPSIAPHDCLGSNINVHTRWGKVMRVVPRENNAINETWISDRDRFSYEGLYHVERLMRPCIRVDNQWQEVSWQSALEFAAANIQQVLHSYHADQIAALASPNATVEELYLLQKLLRQLGSSNIDHRLRQVDFADQESMPAFPGFTLSFAELENCDVILLVGSNIQKEQPCAALRVRKAIRNGAQVFAVNMVDYHFNFNLTDKKIVAPHEFIQALAGMMKAFIPNREELAGISVTDQDRKIAAHLQSGKKVGILLGALAFNHPHASLIRSFAKLIAEHCGATICLLTEGANTAGAWLAGAIPHRYGKPGLDAQAMLNKPRKAYFLLNVEPDVDCANPMAAMFALEQAECVISFSMFKNSLLEQVAHVILPIAPFTETSGTFVNAMGEWQSFTSVASAYGESRPAWKVLRVLGKLLQLKGFEYASSEAVCKEARASLAAHASVATDKNFILDLSSVLQTSAGIADLSRIGEIPLYSTDSLVRRAKALQATQKIVEGELVAVRLHPETAQLLKLKEGIRVNVKQQNYQVRLPVVVDTRVPLRAALIAGGILASSGLSELFGKVEITP